MKEELGGGGEIRDLPRNLPEEYREPGLPPDKQHEPRPLLIAALGAAPLRIGDEFFPVSEPRESAAEEGIERARGAPQVFEELNRLFELHPLVRKEPLFGPGFETRGCVLGGAEPVECEREDGGGHVLPPDGLEILRQPRGFGCGVVERNLCRKKGRFKEGGLEQACWGSVALRGEGTEGGRVGARRPGIKRSRPAAAMPVEESPVGFGIEVLVLDDVAQVVALALLLARLLVPDVASHDDAKPLAHLCDLGPGNIDGEVLDLAGVDGRGSGGTRHLGSSEGWRSEELYGESIPVRQGGIAPVGGQFVIFTLSM